MGKRTIKNNSPLVSYLICFGASALAVILFSFLMAILASLTENPGGLTDILSLVSLLISGAFCGIFSTKFYKQGSVGFATLVALGIALVMLICCLIISGAKMPASALMNYACYVGIATLVGFFAKSKGKKRRIKHR